MKTVKISPKIGKKETGETGRGGSLSHQPALRLSLPHPVRAGG